jgi:NAD(P)-dependent dehydrogenase (short-subunit alcohol dehydrogenase family)
MIPRCASSAPRRFLCLCCCLLQLLLLLQKRAAGLSVSSSKSKFALVTGSTDGIGQNTATRLAQAGYSVFVHGRNQERVAASVSRIIETSGNSNVQGFTADISSLAGMRKLTGDVARTTDKLDVLVNNCGIFEEKFQLSEDGIELVFATNVLSMHVITNDLLPLLKRSASARVINVSSISQGYEAGLLDPQFKLGGYSDHRSYSLSKLLAAMLTFEQHKRFGTATLTFNTLDPGTVNTKMLLAGWGPCGIRVEQANDEFYLASSQEVEGVGGQYFVGRIGRRANPACYDDSKRRALWDELERLSSA